MIRFILRQFSGERMKAKKYATAVNIINITFGFSIAIITKESLTLSNVEDDNWDTYANEEEGSV